MGRRRLEGIAGIGAVEGEPSDPFEKWNAYNELYILSDETVQALGNLTGTLQKTSGLPLKVEHYSWNRIKDNADLRDKVKRMIAIGAVGFGVIDELGALQTLRFHNNVAQSIHQGQQIQLTSLEEGKAAVDHICQYRRAFYRSHRKSIKRDPESNC